LRLWFAVISLLAFGHPLQADVPVTNDPTGMQWVSNGVEGTITFFRAEEHYAELTEDGLSMPAADASPAEAHILLVNSSAEPRSDMLICGVFQFTDVSRPITPAIPFELAPGERRVEIISHPLLDHASSMRCMFQSNIDALRAIARPLDRETISTRTRNETDQ
jgi:hypothetical protein